MRTILILILMINTPCVFSQKILSLKDAILLLKEQNYDVEIARQNIESLRLLTSKYNRGYLPVFALSADAGFGLASRNTTYNSTDEDLDVNNAKSSFANASIGSQYLLYNGGLRELNNERNIQNYENSKLSLRDTETLNSLTLAQVYYSIAQQYHNEILLRESYKLSDERFQRAVIYYELGSRSKVDLLNAEVDLRQDSLNLVTIENNIDNLKVKFNQLLSRSAEDFEVDTSLALDYELEQYASVYDKMLRNNIHLSLLRKNLKLNEIECKIVSKTSFPEINAASSYMLGYQKNDDKSDVDRSRNNGFYLGVNLNWNIVDGGSRKLEKQLAEINRNNAVLKLAQAENNLIAELRSVWNNYQNNLKTMKILNENIEANQRNFERVRELYNAGQQSSIEYRQAQLNLINARLLYTNASYSAKFNELELTYLMGRSEF